MQVKFHNSVLYFDKVMRRSESAEGAPLVRRLCGVSTALILRVYGAFTELYLFLFFLLRLNGTVMASILLRSSEIAEYCTVESLLKTTPELRLPVYYGFFFKERNILFYMLMVT
jgi:hypothetical protein